MLKPIFRSIAPTTLAMTNDNLLPFSFPAVSRKEITAAFYGGRLTSDGGVMLLAMAEGRLGIAFRLARCYPDRRDLTRITHTLADMIRARIFAISCGYEDADDLDFSALIPLSSSPAGDCPTRAQTCVRSRRCRDWRMHPRLEIRSALRGC